MGAIIMAAMLVRLWQNDEHEARVCAEMMAATDPWLKLGRGVEQSMLFLTDGTKEIHLATDGEEILGFIVLNMRGAFAGYIQTICVAAPPRDRGVGTQLIRFA